MAQTGQSEAIHSPDAWASTVVKLTLIDRGRLHGCDLMLTQSFAHNVEAAR
jgi:hypothetical protein